jgi:hypothetical protein
MYGEHDDLIEQARLPPTLRSFLRDLNARRGALAVLVLTFAVVAIVQATAGNAAQGCSQLSPHLLTCEGNAAPPAPFGTCPPFRTPGNLTVWTCRS